MSLEYIVTVLPSYKQAAKQPSQGSKTGRPKAPGRCLPAWVTAWQHNTGIALVSLAFPSDWKVGFP
jgi:hypothetical protein